MKYTIPPEWGFITPDMMRLRYGTNFDRKVFKRWLQSGELVKLKKGLYRKSSHKMRSEVDRFTVSGYLCQPSYVSLHAALHYFGFIPEHVYEATCITTSKARFLEAEGNRYSYRQIKPDSFFGYETVQWRGHFFNIARPEKAFLDFAYLEPAFSDPDWIEGMRFDYFGLKEDIDWRKMFQYAGRMNSNIVIKRIELLRKVHDL